MTTDIRQRLAGLRIEIAPQAAMVHHDAIAAELRSPSAVPPLRFRRRRLPVVVLAALLVVAVSATGAFAESAVPGDRLYPVKQATEWVRAWIDPTVPADHRIDELETLLDGRAVHEAISDQLLRAEDAVARASVGDAIIDAPLVDRLGRVRDLVPPPTETTDEPLTSDQGTVDSPQIGEDIDDRVPPADGGSDATEEGAPEVTRDQRRAELEAWCQKVRTAGERGDKVPQWMLHRCHQLLSPPRDSP